MKTLSKISIILLSLLACSTFSCKKELAPISQKLKPKSLLSSDSVGQVTTIATGVKAYGLAVDAAGNLYATTDQREIYKITPAGIITLFANDGYIASGITFGPDSALYITNFSLITKITLSGEVTTVAGQQEYYNAPIDGPLAQAKFDVTQQITSCADGNLYVTELNVTPYPYPFDIRVITPGASGIVYTLYRPGPVWPQGGIAIYQGNVYFSDASNTIAKIALDGTVSTFATGIAANNIVFDSSGNLYASDGVQNKIFKITPDGSVSTLAEGFKQPFSLAIHGDYLYVGDVGFGDYSIRKIVIK